MAIINEKTGYYGYTIDQFHGSTGDKHGNVTKAIFGISYEYRTNPDVIISGSSAKDEEYDKENDHWAAWFADGSVINLHRYNILYVNHDNAVIEFDMENSYPSNSPCFLVRRTDEASIKITNNALEEPKITVNTATGNFAYTTEGYDGGSYEYGCVDRLIVTIPFRYSEFTINFEISNSNDVIDFGVRMGDGNIIELKDPEIIYLNQDNAVVVFKMLTPYPSNSPGILLYLNEGAYYKYEYNENEIAYVAVAQIIGIPETIYMGIEYDLSSYTLVMPQNATYQGIEWSVLSGDVVIENNILIANSTGTIKIKATIPNGADETTDYYQSFTLTVEANNIEVVAQAVDRLEEAVSNETTDSIGVIATSDSGEVSYQWYETNSANASTSSSNKARARSSTIATRVKLEGETSNKLTINNDSAGTRYVYCEVTSPGAEPIQSAVTTIYTSAEVKGINIKLNDVKTNSNGTIEVGSSKDIVSSTTSLGISERLILSVTPTPAGADTPAVAWTTSNPAVLNISTVDGYTVLTAGCAGSGTITATTINCKIENDAYNDDNTDGKNDKYKELTTTLNVTVAEWKPVTGIRLDTTSIESDTNDVYLSSTIIPSNTTKNKVTYKLDSWVPDSNYIDSNEIDVTSNPSAVECVLSTEGKIYAACPGTAVVIMTVSEGSYINADFSTKAVLTVTKKFVPVTGINIELSSGNDILTPGYMTTLSASVSPKNADVQTVNFTLVSAGTTGATLTGNTIIAKNKGENDNGIKIRATCIGGKGTNSDFYIEKVYNVKDLVSVSDITMYIDGDEYTDKSTYNPNYDDTYYPNLKFTISPDNVSIAKIKLTFDAVNMSNSSDTLAMAVYSVDDSGNRSENLISDNTLEIKNNDKVSIYIKQNSMKLDTSYLINVNATITDGIAAGVDFTKLFTIPLETVSSTAYVELKEIDLAYPIINGEKATRAWYPILINQSTFKPYNASVKNNFNPTFRDSRKLEYGGTDTITVSNAVIGYDRSETDESIILGKHYAIEWYLGSDIMSYLDEVAPAIHLDTQNIYLCSYDIGKANIDITVPNGGTLKTDNTTGDPLKDTDGNLVIDPYQQQFDFEFKPPYIQVKGVSNIPNTIIVGKDYIFSPELETDHGTQYNTYTWDEEVPSYTDITLDMTINGNGINSTNNTANAEIKNTDTTKNILYASKTGSFTFNLTVENGLQEPLDWYSTSYYSEYPYTDSKFALEVFNNGTATIPSTVNDWNNYITSLKNSNIDEGFVAPYVGAMLLVDVDKNHNGEDWVYVVKNISNGNIAYYDYNSEDSSKGGPYCKKTTVGESQSGRSYTESITINVVDDVITKNPLATLTIKKDDKSTETSKIEVYSLGDFYKLCNDRSADSEITVNDKDGVGGQTFKKNQITEVKFWDKVDLVGSTITPIENITLISANVDKNSSLDLSNSIISPTTATNKSVKWSIVSQFDESDPENPNLGSIQSNKFKSNAHNGYVIIRATVANGLDDGIDFTKCFIIKVGYPSNDTIIGAINITSDATRVYSGEDNTFNLTAELVGSNESYTSEYSSSVTWECDIPGVDIGIIRRNELTPQITINSDIPAGTLVTITASVSVADPYDTSNSIIITESFVIYVAEIPAYTYEDTPVKSLRNFGRNFTSLTKIDRIPLVSGETDAYRNFLMGCTSFNQAIEIPEGVTGDRCLKYFLRDCTSFNSSIKIPSTVTGTGCMHGFLYHCTSYNQPLELPEGITGESCIERLLAECTSFNSAINFPDTISGKRCMRDVLFDAYDFDKSIKLPRDLAGEESLWCMMYNTRSFTSTITISKKNMLMGKLNGMSFCNVSKYKDNVNGALADDVKEKNREKWPFINTAAKISGTGSDLFIRKFPKTIDTIPFCNFEQDESWVQPEIYKINITSIEGAAILNIDTSNSIYTGWVDISRNVDLSEPYVYTTSCLYKVLSDGDYTIKTTAVYAKDDNGNLKTDNNGKYIIDHYDYTKESAITGDIFVSDGYEWTHYNSKNNIEYTEYADEIVDVYISPTNEKYKFESASMEWTVDVSTTSGIAGTKALVSKYIYPNEDNHIQFTMPNSDVSLTITYKETDEPD